MPEKFDNQELVDTWVGVYQQPSDPPSLSPRFASTMHNFTLRGGMPHTRPGQIRLNSTLAGDGTRTVFGLGVWRDATLGDLLLIACGSLVQAMPINGGAPATLTTAYPTGFRSSPTGARTVFAQLGGQVFIANGVDDNVKYNGTDVTKMGIAAPVTLAAPTLSAGVLVGTRRYFATHISDTAHKSTESAGTGETSVTFATQQGTFVAPAVVAADPQVDRWNLYATLLVDNGLFYRVNTTPVTLATSIIDNVTDAVLVAGPTLTRTQNAEPPGIFTTLAVHQGRLVGVAANDPNTLVWSDLSLGLDGVFFKPENWPAGNRLPFGEQGGTKITALVSFFEWLLVFQNFGSWAVKNTLADSASRVVSPLLVAPDNRGVGVSELGNIGIAENKVYVASKDLIRRIRRELVLSDVPDLSIDSVSGNIDTLYQQVDFDQGGVALYDRDERRFIFIGQGKGAIT